MYIIAEIGSNYHSMEDCINSIAIAKGCGADAVKFQHYESTELWGTGEKVVTPEEWLPILKRAAKKNGIAFGCTFFTAEKLFKHHELLDFFKIASSNMMDTKLLQAAHALRNGRTCYVSTGGHTQDEINEVRFMWPGQFEYLYCKSAYPSYVNDIDRVKEFDGISDHSLDIYPAYAVTTGFVVEKHVNLVDSRMTADCKHSLDRHQFTRFCKYIKGEIPELLAPEEWPMRQLHNVRLVASDKISPGDKFTWKNVRVQRGIMPEPNYISPFESVKVIGKKSKRTIQKLETITLDNVQV